MYIYFKHTKKYKTQFKLFLNINTEEYSCVNVKIIFYTFRNEKINGQYYL